MQNISRRSGVTAKVINFFELFRELNIRTLKIEPVRMADTMAKKKTYRRCIVSDGILVITDKFEQRKP